jgi:hypothetical protein
MDGQVAHLWFFHNWTSFDRQNWATNWSKAEPKILDSKRAKTQNEGK